MIMDICCAGSGVNWTGPRYAGPDGVRVEVGYAWPAPRTVHLMCFGTFESATAQRTEIEAWAAAHDVELTAEALGGASILELPVDGVTGLAWGFRSCAEIARIEAERSAERARSEAETLLAYRRDGAVCPRRERLERAAATGESDGFLLYPQDMPLFLILVEASRSLSEH